MLTHYSIAALAALLALGLALVALALAHRRSAPAPQLREAWTSYRFGYATYALIFLAFDMEMIFMYPWAVVFAELGIKAFLDMLVFIGLLLAGIAYAWGCGALRWE
ncbi:MAG: NADH-quinone oxidoreductase subunit A [Pseudomonadota bacterium]